MGPSPAHHAALQTLSCAWGLGPGDQWFPLYSFQNTYPLSSHKPLSHRHFPSQHLPPREKQKLSDAILRQVGSRALTKTPVLWLKDQSSFHDTPEPKELKACAREPQALWLHIRFTAQLHLIPTVRTWRRSQHSYLFLTCAKGWWSLNVDMQEHAGEVINGVAGVQHSVASIHATNISQKSQYPSLYSKCQETKELCVKCQEELQLPKSCQPTREPRKHVVVCHTYDVCAW